MTQRPSKAPLGPSGDLILRRLVPLALDPSSNPRPVPWLGRGCGGQPGDDAPRQAGVVQQWQAQRDGEQVEEVVVAGGNNVDLARDAGSMSICDQHTW